MGELKVNLGLASYTINIGINNFADIGNMLSARQFSPKVLIVTDSNVSKLYASNAVSILHQAGFQPEVYCIEAGEDSKNMTNAMLMYTKAIDLQLDRKSPIIALGGGVVGDLAGFVAATYLRGVPFFQIPTSLLAQVDSSIGGKVAVNHPQGKNLIGAFYQPQAVLIDVALLHSLPERQLYTGLAEVIKYSFIADKGLFEQLNNGYSDIITHNWPFYANMIRRSCEIKASVVEQDEKETGLRAILNFGHTIGHAVEAETKFTMFSHGEAIAIGMHAAALISEYLGICGSNTMKAVCELLTKFNLPVTATCCNPENLLKRIAIDKKTIAGKTNWVLIEDIGRVTVRNDVPESIVFSALKAIT